MSRMKKIAYGLMLAMMMSDQLNEPEPKEKQNREPEKLPEGHPHRLPPKNRKKKMSKKERKRRNA